jgi:ABC-type Fe3+-hydroxamate transport system substrate-binding protein
MKVVSLVPSLTETLLECGVNVVGRTRFCVHPGGDIPVVGGTKQVDWEKVKALGPDFVLFDKEENTKEMAEACPFPKLVTHVTSLASLARDLRMLAEKLGNAKLRDLAARAEKIRPQAGPSPIPALKTLKAPAYSRIKTILYLVWRDPWIAVSRDTFIGDMLAHFGRELPRFPERYPRISLENYDPASTLLLFSSEPYPFGHKEEEIQRLGFPSLIVDGEAFGWFGIRAINFLDHGLRR